MSSLTQCQGKKLKTYECDSTLLRQEIEKLRQSQLAEIDERCREVDALKQQLSEQLNCLQQDHDSHLHILTSVTAERNTLLDTLSKLEVENSSLISELSHTKHQYNAQSSLFSSLSDKMEQINLENTALRSKLTRVQRYI